MLLELKIRLSFEKKHIDLLNVNMLYLHKLREKKTFNPIKAVRSESMFSQEKALENRYRVELHVYTTIFQG